MGHWAKGKGQGDKENWGQGERLNHLVFLLQYFSVKGERGIYLYLCNLDKISRPDAIAKRIAEYYSPALTELVLQPPLAKREQGQRDKINCS
ncbi:hypothetical protein A6769_08175 [Nostoc punctiforme NIES-2108]|uniref:Uncharacterized protein n=1 Tax=Nostoc punctiforme NIES-2108 TaxID=1356359 RepID=A0A367RTH3_NOSPU|nr:hypothetical protein A6769_08175 [Nostoc punctiforme NIES-2108]